MEGTWGRRIFGTIEKGASITKFTLVMETREKQKITQINYANNEDLEQIPGFYGQLLDMMVLQIEKSINHAEGVPS